MKLFQIVYQKSSKKYFWSFNDVLKKTNYCNKFIPSMIDQLPAVSDAPAEALFAV